MFFASANSTVPHTRSPGGVFAGDLIASLVTIGALGALLVAIQAKPAPDATMLKALPGIQKAQASQRFAVALPSRQPSDEAATPDAEEQLIANAMLAFALSKVSPLQPEPMSSIPASPSILASVTPAPRKMQKAQTSPRITAPRIPAGTGQVGFAQAEWPVRVGETRFQSVPRDRPVLAAMTRFVPRPETLVTGAQSLASGARKTVNDSVSGLRNGVGAVQDKALAVAGKLW